ncbi:MAG: 2-dehydro-3-deoxygalactonokinase [Acetobacteraceae bacterium]|nr:2-dehydro-3-deoxygalactonokinase [Acetobacteraceae bacterium]MBV8577892.1 2-dehydro-3-deoxygalactonokinase [Acetobacteraceae bacterium]
MIGVDWGTSSFRAFRITENGTIRDRRSGPRGILKVQDGRFADALREEIGPWLAGGENHVLLAGMIGSRQGWVEAPYLACPAGAADLAEALTEIGFDWAKVKLVPGLSARDDSGVPEVMRGEETQIAGVLPMIGNSGLACLPGTHSKWARIEGGRIAGFATYMTGEAFAVLRGHTILGRTMRDGPSDPGAFEKGLARAAEPGGLLHHLFGVRALVLAGELTEAGSASYLSGLVIGHEISAALPSGAEVHLIGDPDLCSLYARAIAAGGGRPFIQDGEAAARGLFLIGAHARWN